MRLFDACMKTSRNDVIARVLFSGKDKYYIHALLHRSKFNICRLALHSLNFICKQFKNISFMAARENELNEQLDVLLLRGAFGCACCRRGGTTSGWLESVLCSLLL